MENFQLFTDATADIPSSIAEQAGLNIIPMDFTLGGKDYTHYADERQLSSAEFYASLRNGETSKTVQINMARYYEFFEPVLENGFDILYICFSSALSGTYQTSLIAISELEAKYPDRRIVSIDSKCASIGEGVLALTAAKLKNSGWSFDDLSAWVTENRDVTAHQFVVDDLDHLRRGGRISPLATVIGSALAIKPFLRVDMDGGLFVHTKIRGRIKSMTALTEEVKKNFDSLKSNLIFVGHGDCIEDARTVAESIKAQAPNAEIVMTNMGPIIGTHTGANTLAVAFLGNKK